MPLIVGPSPAGGDKAANDQVEPLALIPAGFAVHALSAALDDLARAFVLVEATAMALARQLDSQATEGT